MLHTYVLITKRCIDALQRAQSEAVTFLGSQESSRSLYAIPGLDYVAHEDILPYTTSEKNPIHHELFDKFLTYHPDKGVFHLPFTLSHLLDGFIHLVFFKQILHLVPSIP